MPSITISQLLAPAGSNRPCITISPSLGAHFLYKDQTHWLPCPISYQEYISQVNSYVLFIVESPIVILADVGGSMVHDERIINQMPNRFEFARREVFQRSVERGIVVRLQEVVADRHLLVDLHQQAWRPPTSMG